MPAAGMTHAKLPERALVICGHPDDEVIGVGGTIAKLTGSGVEVDVLMFANGNEGFADLAMKDRIVEVRKRERENVREILGISHYETHDYGDYEIPVDAVSYKVCIRAIRQYRPDMILTHYWSDYTSHRAVATLATEAWWQAGWRCSMDLGEPWRAGKLYYFETLHLLPEVSDVVDISEAFDAKLRAMRAYSSQHEVLADILQRIEGLAKLRGAAVGAAYGEALLEAHFVPRRADF